MSEIEPGKIAVPLVGGQFSMHFGQSTGLAVFAVDWAQRKIVSHAVLPLPGQHACGMAGWLKEQGVQTVIVGGLGRGALANMAAAQLDVYAGIPGIAPAELAQACLEGRLLSATATCAGHTHGDAQHEGHEHEHGGSCHCKPQPASE